MQYQNMNLLDNELILKYFGSDRAFNTDSYAKKLIAERIIDAMQAPIKKGERYLSIDKQETIDECIATEEYPSKNKYQFDDFHPTDLRLPDYFQKSEDLTIKHCVGCRCNEPIKCDGEHHGKPCPELHPEKDNKPKDFLAEKIKNICQKSYSSPALREDLEERIYELVHFMRETK